MIVRKRIVSALIALLILVSSIGFTYEKDHHCNSAVECLCGGTKTNENHSPKELLTRYTGTTIDPIQYEQNEKHSCSACSEFREVIRETSHVHYCVFQFGAPLCCGFQIFSPTPDNQVKSYRVFPLEEYNLPHIASVRLLC